ncbi:OsWAK receptor-like protein kinase [Musa troglodytarum]|uniref:OsWAK receptor-like protein kinase n=1 Tax=Musa troglodytarum TaxID=320322 RepID=A0A9E7JRB6_9LILI|nr:OsWAK receptor-like protein kinase [Musa troglodytarum]
MGLTVVLLLLFLTLGLMGSTGAENTSTGITFPLPSNCPKNCGNISFEYPFGIGSGCFRPGFNLTCRNQTTDPSLVLGDGTVEVIDFDMDNGIVYVKTPIVTMGVDEDYFSQTLIDLRNFPFSFNLAANLTDSFTMSVAYNEILVADTTFTPRLLNNCSTKCGDVNISFPFGLEKGCYRDQSFLLTCNTSTKPPNLLFQDYYIVMNMSLEKGTLEVKRLHDYEYFSFVYENQPFISFEELIILNWIITDQSCQDAKQNMTTFACVEHSSCKDEKISNNGQKISGYRCECNDGYEGNPYLPNGCTDIDECIFPQKYVCYGTCTNTMGSYSCTCPPGTTGDPKRACIPDKKQTVLLGVIIGVSNGVGLLLLSTSLIILRRKWKKRKQKRIREKHFRQNHGLLLQQLISSREDVAERTKIFPLEEIEKATNNFDETRVLGRGGHGTVYKGILSDQRVVAIKKSKFVKKSEIDQFVNEVAILSQINHRNVVKLFGCCLETEVPLLIYEFISNGALSDHLHTSDESSALSWEARLRIAAETAGALAYLHSAASISILHRDVKSSNILLDDHFTAKVSDFGASRFIPLDQTHIVTGIQGTFGYLDPEYYQTSQLTEKSDVYSFGVILLELLTGKKPIFSIEHENKQNLSMYFLQALKEKRYFDLVEDRVMKEGTKQELMEVIQLVATCLKFKGSERPPMKEVEYKLQSLRRIRKNGGRHIAEVKIVMLLLTVMAPISHIEVKITTKKETVPRKIVTDQLL